MFATLRHVFCMIFMSCWKIRRKTINKEDNIRFGQEQHHDKEWDLTNAADHFKMFSFF